MPLQAMPGKLAAGRDILGQVCLSIIAELVRLVYRP
jgi:hypothetical protein